MDSSSLDELAIKHQTDRASVFTRTWGKPHDYARHYDHIFEGLRKQPVKFLEIGVGGGEGIKMWLDYFSHVDARIYGVDNQRDTNLWDKPGTTERYTFVYGDQSCETFWKCFEVDYGRNWDIIIDDGGHYSDQIITTFHALWPLVKRGGFYAIEDLGVSYGAGSIFVRAQNHMDFIRGLLDDLNTNPETAIESVYFSKELVILQKI
jgi:Methyltransferase domain